MNQFEQIQQRRQQVADHIMKSVGVEFEKAQHSAGEIKIAPDGKQYVWTEYAPGKFDWHLIKRGNEGLTDDDKKETANILQHKSPNNNDSPKHLEQMSDAALKHFISEARSYSISSKLNKMTRDNCKKWAELGEAEQSDRMKAKRSSDEKKTDAIVNINKFLDAKVPCVLNINVSGDTATVDIKPKHVSVTCSISTRKKGNDWETKYSIPGLSGITKNSLTDNSIVEFNNFVNILSKSGNISRISGELRKLI